MNVVRIDDALDPRIADYRNVPDPELIARRGLFVAEGRLVVERLLTQSRFTPRSLLITDTALESVRTALDGHPALPVYLVAREVMNAVTGFNIHRGCLALGERRPLPHWRELVDAARLLVVLERVGNADNVGAIFRNAAAFGADAVLLGPACADPLYRKAIRTSMGAALTVPFASLDPWPAALRELASVAPRKGVPCTNGPNTNEWAIVALTPSATKTVCDVAATVRGRRIALVVGHEGEGLTAGALAAADHQARIPMAPGVDSLNAATAAAVALYELTR